MSSRSAVAQISLTNKCQCNCRHCGVKSINNKLGDVDITIEQLSTLYRDLKLAGITMIDLFGGEPSLHPQLLDIVKLTKLFGFTTILETNGAISSTPLLLDELKKFGLDAIYLSLDDYDQKNHNQRRRNNLVFDQVITTLHRAYTVGIPTTVSFVANDRAYFMDGRINTFLEFCVTNLATNVRILFPSYIGNNANAKKDFSSYSDELSLLEYIDVRYYDLVFVEAPSYTLRNILINKQRIQCPAKQNYFYIATNGLVTPCAYLPIVFGDVNKESVVEILQRMHEHPLLNSCYSVYCPSRDPAFLEKHCTQISEEQPLKNAIFQNRLNLGQACNNNCQGCTFPKTQDTFEQILLKIKSISAEYSFIHLYGGEIFLRKDIWVILDSIPEHVSIILHTNGKYFADQQRMLQLKKYRIYAVKVNFFGTNDIDYDRYAQIPESFNEAILGLKHLIQAKLPVSIYLQGTYSYDLKFFENLGVMSVSFYENGTEVLDNVCMCFGLGVSTNKIVWFKNR